MRLRGYLEVPDQDLEIVKQHLPEHIKLTLAEAGCISFKVYPDPENQNRYQVEEVFANQQAFETHQDRVKSSAWGEATKHLKRHYKISEM